MCETIGEQKDIIVTINHGVGEYDIKFIQQIESNCDKAFGPLGFSRSGSTKGNDKCELVYFQFAQVTKKR